MNIYTMPLSLNLDEINTNDSCIDMSNLLFPLPKEKLKRASFIYIRNSCLNMNFDFSKCSFSDKEEFLLMFIEGNINVKIPVLASTWLEILLFFRFNINEIINESILSKEEIEKFIEHNNDIINEIYTLIISLPMCAIYFYSKKDKFLDISVNDIEETDYDRINIDNFIQLFDYNDFILLIQPHSSYKPMYYKKYFADNNNSCIEILLKKLPYLDILNVMLTTNSDVQKVFIEGISDLVSKL